MAFLSGRRPLSCLLLALAMLTSSARPSCAESTTFEGLVDARREALKEGGIEIGATYIGETLSNLRGGLRRGTIYEGRLDVQFDADFGKLANNSGLTFHANAYQIHGTGPSRYYVGSLAAVSGIEALPSIRLVELWLEQTNTDKTLSIRVGKLLADAEFFVSPTATLFVNSTFGWPAIASADLPSGGPATPLATPGLRAKWSPVDKTSFAVGLYNGDPALVSTQSFAVDPQRRNADGTDFSIGGDPLIVAEAAKAYVASGSGPERTGTVKLGYFHHFGLFDDLRFDQEGTPLAAPSSTGIPRRWRGANGVYAIIDQTLYREDETSDRGAAAFLRVSASPSAGSLVGLYADGGLVYKGLIPGRPDDIAGLSLAYSRIAESARSSDRDYALYRALVLPLRRSELVAELTYQAVITKGVTIQPDIQYIASPGGHRSNQRLSGDPRIKNSAVIGLRVTMQY